MYAHTNTLALTVAEWDGEAVVYRVLSKLHVQYNHMSIPKLVAVLKTMLDTRGVGVLTKLADKFVAHDCIKFATAKPNPVLLAPRVPSFNRQVYVDVFRVSGIMILHMVCASSPYWKAAVLAERTGQAVVFALLNFWLRYGSHEKFEDRLVAGV